MTIKISLKSSLLEVTQKHLTESLEQKTELIAQLEEQLALHKEALESKSHELFAMMQRQSEHHDSSDQNNVDLVAAVEFEMTARMIVVNELQAALNENISLNRDLKEELEKQKALKESISDEFH